jgi:hypothetical protein
MKARLLCLLLLSSCSDEIPYDYALRWTCRSPEGCERAEEVKLLDRLNVDGSFFYFHSARNQSYNEGAQRFGSDSFPAGCWWLQGMVMFGQELEPSKLCSVSGGFDLELSIPNRDPSTRSEWLVEAREQGIL